MSTLTIITTPQLVAAHARSVEAEQNRLVTDEFIGMLDPEGTHVVSFSMEHTNYAGTEGIRARVHCKLRDTMEPAEAWIDFMVDDFLSFETIEHPDDAVTVSGHMRDGRPVAPYVKRMHPIDGGNRVLGPDA